MKNHATTLQRLLIALCCLISFGFIANVQAAPKAKKMSVLFVLSAEKGVLQNAAKGHTLTLTGLGPHVLWFTDRPNRKAGFVPTQKFIANWAKSFKGDPPNAGLVHADMSYTRGGKQVPLAIELINPKMSGGQLRFDVRGIGSGVTTSVNTRNLANIRLFIDSAYLYAYMPVKDRSKDGEWLRK